MTTVTRAKRLSLVFLLLLTAVVLYLVWIVASPFLAPIVTEDRMRRRIEGAIAKQIRKDKAASSLFPPDIRVLGRLTTEAPIPIRIVTPVKILGLPEFLDV